MEDGRTMNASGTQDSYMTKSLDQRERTRSRSDITVRRLKNRERQRRYRAKKRLEAEKKKSSVINQSTTPQVELQQNGNLNACINRIHCKRDWKKDARKAHARKYQDETPNSITPALTSTNESQTVCVSPGTKVESPLERKIHHENSFSPVNCETHKPILGRRDWKAEARNNKKTKVVINKL